MGSVEADRRRQAGELPAPRWNHVEHGVRIDGRLQRIDGDVRRSVAMAAAASGYYRSLAPASEYPDHYSGGNGRGADERGECHRYSGMAGEDSIRMEDSRSQDQHTAVRRCERALL